MKLYFAPFACSLAARIAIYEAGLNAEFERVNLKDKTREGGGEYLEINPKGQVAALKLRDGRVLTENAAVLQYLVDDAVGDILGPPPNSAERYKLQEWLSYVATELHKQLLWPLAAPQVPEEAKNFTAQIASKKLSLLDRFVADRQYLLDEFSVADAYLFWFLFLIQKMGVSIDPYPEIKAYFDGLYSRPAVVRAVSDEQALQA
jgi:glutathione S-transferase